jgi:hypothetical protein
VSDLYTVVHVRPAHNKGFIPLLGDIVNVLLNYNLVVKPAKRLDLPSDLIARMQLNNAISAGVG